MVITKVSNDTNETLSNAVTNRNSGLPQAGLVEAQNAGFLSKIEKIMSSEKLDMDRLEKFVELHEKWLASEAERQFNLSLSSCQAELPVIKRGASVSHKGARFKYASHEDIMSVYKPILGRHGFSLSFDQKQVNGGMEITGTLHHKDGHKKTSNPLFVPTDTSGSKNPVQAVGSTLSYGIRYCMKMMLNVATEGDDDDGVAAGLRHQPGQALPQGGSLLSQAQINILRQKLSQKGITEAEFCRRFGVKIVENYSGNINDALTWIDNPS